jgi:hypothetical protein
VSTSTTIGKVYPTFDAADRRVRAILNQHGVWTSVHGVPDTLWAATRIARQHETCTREECGAPPGQDCTCPGGVHLRRCIAAFMGGHLEHHDIAVVISWAAVHYGDGTIIPTLSNGSAS